MLENYTWKSFFNFSLDSNWNMVAHLLVKEILYQNIKNVCACDYIPSIGFLLRPYNPIVT